MANKKPSKGGNGKSSLSGQVVKNVQSGRTLGKDTGGKKTK